MVKRKLLIFILGLSVLISGCGLIYGMVSVAVTNPFVTGIVDISLTEYQQDANEEVLWEDNPTILPGDVISKIPRIYNDGNDCYIRAKITFRETDELNDSHLLGISEDWAKADDGYYYYTKILPHGEDVDIFKGLTIPTDLSQDSQGEQFYIDIDVDAIQSDNFTPQFDSAQPWGGVEILACEKEGLYEISAYTPSDTQSFQIVYQGGTEELISNSDNFFANIPFLMPGDVYSESVSLVNDGDETVTLHFRSVALDDSELLDKITLKITTVIGGKSEIFYEGTLKAVQLSDDTILAEIPAGVTAEFNFEISVPAELNNKYSISASAVQWIFATDVTETPKTGDTTNLGFYAGGTVVSLMGLSLLLVTGKKKKKEGEYE